MLTKNENKVFSYLYENKYLSAGIVLALLLVVIVCVSACCCFCCSRCLKNDRNKKDFDSKSSMDNMKVSSIIEKTMNSMKKVSSPSLNCARELLLYQLLIHFLFVKSNRTLCTFQCLLIHRVAAPHRTQNIRC